MVKNSLKKKISLFLLISGLCFTNASLLWAQNAPILHDNADLLTDEQEAALIKDMAPIMEYGGVAFVTNSDSYSGEASDFAKKLCNQYFNGDSGTVLLIDMYNRRIEIYSTGFIYSAITKARANGIADNVYLYATLEEYYECAQKTYEQMLQVLEGGRISVPMRYVSNLLVAACLVFGFMFLFLYIGRVNMNIALKRNLVQQDHNFFDDEELDILLDKKSANASHVKISDTTLVKETKKMHFEASSSGGSYSGGHSSGGGFHGGGGGGGGHSF